MAEKTDEAPDKTQAMQTPLYEMLESVPRETVLSIEMRDTEGNIYGHQSIPVGWYAHEAAEQLRAHISFRAQISMAVSHIKLLMEKSR